MLSTILDEALVATLLAMGGESLRAQLLEDLRRCEHDLSTYCATATTDHPTSPKRLRHVLHELRGIALTIGAQTLAQNCAAAEARAMTSCSAQLLQQLEQIVHGSREVRARLLLASGDMV